LQNCDGPNKHLFVTHITAPFLDSVEDYR